MVKQRRTVVASNYNIMKYPFSALAYECCDVVERCEPADLLVPEAIPVFRTDLSSNAFLAGELVRRGITRVRRWRNRPAVPTMQSVRLTGDYDLFFYVTQFTSGLADVEQIRGWRERCRWKAALIFESWSSLLERNRAQLKLLDDFDHVFVLNRQSIENIRKYTRTPCSFLAPATDALRFKPPSPSPERVIDVYSMGRRAPVTHAQLVAMAEENRIFYVYDAWSGGTASDWRDSRLMTRAHIQRCKYFMAYAPDVGSPLLVKQAGGEQSLSARYFEGAAGGSVMIGSAPRCREFWDLFDWPDALIEIPSEPEDVGEILSDLNAQPERMARIRSENVRQSLLRHDWAHRWRTVLETFDLPPTAGLKERLTQLSRAAGQVASEREMSAA
jgi:hypothetical protein